MEFGNPIDLERNRWTRSALRIGDVVTVEGVPARGPSRQALARSVVHKATGKRLFESRPRDPREPAAPRPRRAGPTDRCVSAGPWPEGLLGSAERDGAGRTTGTPVRMNDEGLLVNLADADRVAPLQPWAKALYLHRQRTLLEGRPDRALHAARRSAAVQMPNGVQFIEQRELGRILVLMGGGNRNWRVIYTDGRPQGQAAEVVLTYYGNSVGRWEKDTLVVDSVGYNERFWFTSGGLAPHRGAAPGGALLAAGPEHAEIRGHGRRSAHVHAAVDGRLDAAVGAGRGHRGILLRGERGIDIVRDDGSP